MPSLHGTVGSPGPATRKGAGMRSRPLVAFFVIAFAVTWSTQILGLVLARKTDFSLLNEDNLLNLFDLLSLRLAPGEAAAFLLYTLGFGPLVAALLVTWAVSGRGGSLSCGGASRSGGWNRGGT